MKAIQRLRQAGLLALASVLLVACSFAAAAAHTTPPKGEPSEKILVRWCPEDAVQVGIGDFDGHRWSRYECIARDDF